MRIKQGANKNFKFYVYERGGKTPVLARPQEIVFTAIRSTECQENVLQKSLDNGITFDDTTGKYVLAFIPNDTINLPPGNYPFDIKIKRADTQYFVVAQGWLKIEKSYTGVI